MIRRYELETPFSKDPEVQLYLNGNQILLPPDANVEIKPIRPYEDFNVCVLPPFMRNPSLK